MNSGPGISGPGYIYDDAQDYQEKTGKPAWSGGHAYYHEKVIETYPWAGVFLIPCFLMS